MIYEARLPLSHDLRERVGGYRVAYSWKSDTFSVFGTDGVAYSFGHRTLAQAHAAAADLEQEDIATQFELADF